MHTRSLLRSILLAALTCAVLLGMAAPASRLLAADDQSHAATAQPAATGDHQLNPGPVAAPELPSLQQGQADIPAPQPVVAATRIPTPTIDLKLLLIAADGSEAALPAIRQSLDYLGAPYTVWVATQRPNQLTAAALSSGDHGFYQGVILTTGSVSYSPDGGATWQSALSQPEWQALWDYEAAFGVRQATWYTFPTADYGFGAFTTVDTSVAPVAATLTPAGQALFPYLNAASPVTIRDAIAYLAPAAGISTTALLMDGGGHALAAVRSYPDGRENLALTFDSNAYSIHHLTLAYGVINWLARGVFLGERKVYLGAQIDDFFIPDETWAPSTPCGTDPELTGTSYRIDGADLHAVASWQQQIQSRPTSAGIRLDMAFNGEGATDLEPNDTLIPATLELKDRFKWINHTFSHLLLTAATYVSTTGEIASNHAIAAQLGLADYSHENIVTPEISGLFNPDAMQAAYDSGVRYLVSDTSHPEQGTPTPNAGTYNQLQPGILMIPRRPDNLFYNVSTPAEWVAEYNCLYSGFWGRNLAYSEILDKESDMFLQYLLRGEIYPWMFHQPNLRAYDGSHTLLGDLLDRTLAKYDQLFNLPIQSPTMDELGRRVAARMGYNQAGVTASIVPGQSITLHAQQGATVPVTGLCGSGAEIYGGQSIAHISLTAGQSITLPLNGCHVAFMSLVLQ
ncbi:MAG: hypothetical protein IPO81_23200 [Kouleothrix sp.]|nr:hypothetical protein [Kouleothrix sp.]